MAHADHAPDQQAPVTPGAADAADATRPADVPGGLAVVRDFINTMDFDENVETFASPAALVDWLADHGLADARVKATDDDVRRAIALREALRELILTNNEGGAPDPGAVAVLNDAGHRVTLIPRFDAAGRLTLEAGEGGVDAALARLLAIVHGAMETGDWPRLKACRNDTCLWAFYDHSKNRSRHWCSMDVCGNQVKARAYRRRRKSAPEQQ